MIGVDEVGRGSWAGPLCVAAVRLNEHIDGLDDSKKLSKLQRKRLHDEVIKENDVAFAWVSALEIDANGLGAALYKAFNECVNALKPRVDELIVIDGPVNYLKNTEYFAKTVISADAHFEEVMAASVIAKHSRDHYMQRQAVRFPEYGFERHSGYGTALHIKNIEKNGICSLHRKSIKPLLKYS